MDEVREKWSTVQGPSKGLDLNFTKTLLKLCRCEDEVMSDPPRFRPQRSVDLDTRPQPDVEVDDPGDEAQAIQATKPKVLSLAVIEAKRKGPSRGNSTSSLLHSLTLQRSHTYHKLPDQEVKGVDFSGSLAVSGIERIRQAMAVRIIERYYSQHARVHPSELFAGTERQAEWGEVVFPSKGASRRRAAKYMHLASWSEPARVARCLAKFWRPFGSRRPKVLIQITGSAQNFRISPRIREAFCKGLVDVARATDAMLITGGMNAGVMDLAGEAMAGPEGHGLPLIGFIPWRRLYGRSQLEGNYGERAPRAYVEAQPNDRHGAHLEPRHTHFVLVDGGQEPATPSDADGWGDEIPAMRSL